MRRHVSSVIPYLSIGIDNETHNSCEKANEISSGADTAVRPKRTTAVKAGENISELSRQNLV